MVTEFFWTLALFVAPGFLISFIDKRLSHTERIAVSVPISCIAYGAVASFLHLLGVRLVIRQVYMVLIISAFTAFVFRKRAGLKGDVRLWCVFAAAAAFRLGLQALAGLPSMQGSFSQYSIARSFFTTRWHTTDIVGDYLLGFSGFPHEVHSSPPLAGFLESMGMLFNSPTPEAAASIGLVFGSMLVFPVYLVGKELFGERAGLIASGLMAANYFFADRSVELLSQTILSYFIVLMVYFASKGSRFSFWSAACASLAYLSDYAAVWFILSVLSFLTVANRRNIYINYLLYPGFVFAAIALPWFWRNIRLFGNPLFTTAKYSPIMASEGEHLMLVPPTVDSYLWALGDGPMGFLNAIAIRFANLVASTAPLPGQAQGASWMLKGSFFGLVGPLVFALAIIKLFEMREQLRAHPLAYVILIAGIAAHAAVGYPVAGGLAATSLSPLIPAFIVLSAAKLANTKNSMLLTAVACTVLLQGAVLSLDRMGSQPERQEWEDLFFSIPDSARVMSVQGDKLNFFTGNRVFVTPDAGWRLISRAIRNWRVDYYLLTPADLASRDIDEERLLAISDKVAQRGAFGIYRINATKDS